ncbi:MAG: hypothetical protein KDJ65_24645 [Anaerolineae bacterium]|nr:hypothetical protein [Anaerolineae bacterium]
MSTIQNRPAISDVLIRASANMVFRSKLLSNPSEALLGLNLSPEDTEILTTVRAHTLEEYARQIKTRLILNYHQ